MPTVYRINTRSGEKTKVFIPDALWGRMLKRPNVFKGQFRFEPIPKTSPIYTEEITDKKSPIYSGIPKVNDDLAEPKEKEIATPYTEEEYRKDLEIAKICVKEGQKEDAKFFFERAYKFRKSGYVKGQINKL